MELDDIRLFDVLVNTLNGELAVVMSVSSGHLDLRDKTGAVSRYKFGEHFALASDSEASAFRAALLLLRKKQREESGRKRRTRSVAAVVKRFSKKR